MRFRIDPPRILVSVAIWVFFVLGFFPTYALFGTTATTFAMIPVVVSTWLLGLHAVPFIWLLSTVLTPSLVAVTGASFWETLADLLPGMLAGLPATVAVGWASNAFGELKIQNAKRLQAEEALRQAQEELEARVQERTLELETEIAERKRAEAESRQRTAQLEAVRQIGNEITGELDLNSLLNSIAERALELCGGITSSVYLYNPQLDVIERAITARPVRTPSPVVRKRGEGLIGKVWETNAPIVINDYGSWDERSSIYDGRPTRAVIGVPVHWGNDFLGVLNVVAEHPHQYTPEHVALLSMFADQVAIAVKNARLYDQARQEIEERKRAEQALRVSEERYALAARGANDGLWDWDLKTQQIYFSPRWKAMLDYAEDAIGCSPEDWFRLVHPDDMSNLQADLTDHLEGRTPQFENEHRLLHADGHYRWMLSRGIAVRGEDGRPLRIAGSLTDTTERKDIEKRLMYDALHEPLTGLANRALFIDRLAHLLKSTKRHPHQLAAIFFLDLDRFKVINDSLGHHIGDQLLIQAARRLESCFRTTDTVARFGGDEFAILVEDVRRPVDTSYAAQRIQAELARPFIIDHHELLLSASIGIALTQRDGTQAPPYTAPEEILRDADTAMYRAKALGKARHVIFDTSMHTYAVALMKIEADLRHALERQEFILYYQPVISLATGEITSAEALIRWQHPERGVVPPAEFIPVAEETGLVVPIGQWTLGQACRQAKIWHTLGYSRLQVAVNFSARQFQRHSLSAQIKQVLIDTDLPPTALQIEITERVAMQDVDMSIRVLQELDEIGIEISIDDFGNSYSAFGSLKHFPFKNLKIDKSFLVDIAIDPDNAAITTAIIAMARALKLRVIAEGVETRDQLEFLRLQNCDEVQGFLLSEPLTAEAFAALLAQQPLNLTQRKPGS